MVNVKKNLATEEKIITAATEVFMERGRDGARMQEIADRAAINKALLHYYFRSKDRLFEMVFQREITTILDKILNATSGSVNIDDFLNEFIGMYIDNLRPRQNLMRFILWEANSNRSGFLDTFRMQVEARGYQKNPVVQRLEKAVAAGEIRPVDVNQVALSLISSCLFPVILGPVLQRFMINLPEDEDIFYHERKQHIFEMIWNSIRPEQGE
jgi:TetR/AcrR family transcriptional regulator